MANPPGLIALADEIERLIPNSGLAGISGNTATHFYGYHMSIDYLLTDSRSEYGANDPSIQVVLDRNWNHIYASAIDISYNAQPSLIKTVTARVRAAVHARDPRLFYNGEWVLAEFAGTLNGTVTFAIYTSNGGEDFGAWDDSHLSHNHASIHRKFCNNYAALKGLAAVMAGVPLNPDPLEEIMAMYADKAAFEKALRAIVHDEVTKQTRNELLPADADAKDATKGPHRVETYLNGIPGYVEYSKR